MIMGSQCAQRAQHQCLHLRLDVPVVLHIGVSAHDDLHDGVLVERPGCPESAAQALPLSHPLVRDSMRPAHACRQSRQESSLYSTADTYQACPRGLLSIGLSQIWTTGHLKTPKLSYSAVKVQSDQDVVGEKGLTGKIHILRCGPELGEDILLDVIGNGEEAEDAAARIVDEHHSQRRPHLACTIPSRVISHPS